MDPISSHANNGESFRNSAVLTSPTEMIADNRWKMQADLDRILFDEATIYRRLDELAARISDDYRDRELTVIAVLNGSVILAADLLRRIPLPLKFDCLSVASYHGGIKPAGEPVFRQVPLPDVTGRHVLILDDILDSGGTLASIREKLETAGPLSVRICVLLEKGKIRTWAIEPDYVGFEIADEFVVGYGLDYMERYRNLPCIGVLRKDLILDGGHEQ
jgi:hypoxanthine phosphoribosyltransferase